MNSEEVKHLVRNVLGCACPDEVFSKIEIINNTNLECGEKAKYKINVGDRLLIFILSDADIVDMKTKIKEILFEGKNNRDFNGFNRFRLVILSSEKNLVEKEYLAAFNQLYGIDEKIHLHIIEASSVN